jgi:hypothetical protein
MTMRRRFVRSTASLLLLIAAVTPNSIMAQGAKDLVVCADDRIKTSVLPPAEMAAAEAACGRALAAAASDVERQKAAFYRGVMRFLQVVTKGAANIQQKDGSVAYAPPTLAQVRDARRRRHLYQHRRPAQGRGAVVSRRHQPGHRAHL